MLMVQFFFVEAKMFILFEGQEGVGKTTIARRFVEALTVLGITPLAVREPGGTEAGAAIREVLLNPTSKLTALAEFFLLQASRAQLLKERVEPELFRGGVVVMDRYSLSTLAYQVAGRGLPLAPVLSTLDFATGRLIPDITILLTASVDVGHARQAQMKKVADRFEAEEEAFHQRVHDGYRSFAAVLPKWNIRTIDTNSLSEDEVYWRVVQEIAKVWQPAMKLVR